MRTFINPIVTAVATSVLAAALPSKAQQADIIPVNVKKFTAAKNFTFPLFPLPTEDPDNVNRCVLAYGSPSPGLIVVATLRYKGEVLIYYQRGKSETYGAPPAIIINEVERSPNASAADDLIKRLNKIVATICPRIVPANVITDPVLVQRYDEIVINGFRENGLEITDPPYKAPQALEGYKFQQPNISTGPR